MQQVIEPLGVRRATGAIFGLFAGVGSIAGVVLLGSGQILFGLLFTSMFVGIPWLIHRASRGPGVPGFTLTSDGVLGAAGNEHGLISWGEVDRLTWRGTGLEVNGAACLTLHAQLTDGRSVRVMTYTARRGREVQDIEAQVNATGLLPSHLRFGEADRRSDDLGAPGDGTEVREWSELPLGVKILVIGLGLAFVAPIAIGLLIVPIVLFAVAGPIGWAVSAVLVGAVTVLLLRGAGRLRTPVLSCSFTSEGVVSEFGDGLTVPWREGSVLRIDPSFRGASQGWVAQLHCPGATPVQLSPVLAGLGRIARAVGELVNVKRQGLIPAEVPLVLPADLPVDVVQQLQQQWRAAGPT